MNFLEELMAWYKRQQMFHDQLRMASSSMQRGGSNAQEADWYSIRPPVEARFAHRNIFKGQTPDWNQLTSQHYRDQPGVERLRRYYGEIGP